jgi:hypothetical protein
MQLTHDGATCFAKKSGMVWYGSVWIGVGFMGLGLGLVGLNGPSVIRYTHGKNGRHGTCGGLL